MKYVPVLRYQQEEKAVLSQMKFKKSVPLIEIVSEKPRINMKGGFEEIYTRELSKINATMVMVDIPVYINLSGRTKSNVERFLRPIQANPLLKIKYFKMLSKVTNLVPVISYNPNVYNKGEIKKIADALRSTFDKLAFRMFINLFNDNFKEISGASKKGDILIFDLDTAPHNNPIFKTIYDQVANLGKLNQCKTVLLRSAINQDITNVGFIDDQPIPQADNSLLTSYKNYNFDVFGDFAGIKKDALIEGGTISPGVIFYSWHNNCYIGYKGRIKQLDEFRNHIVPTLLASQYFSLYSVTHKKSCPGCKIINNVYNGTESGKTQAKWKRVSSLHYIHTMEEFL